MKKEYPATHSMDSEWFAIDKDGNIGFFDTEQDGSLPIQFDMQHYVTEFIADFTHPIQGRLRQLYLHEQQIEEIIKRCTKKQLLEVKNECIKETFTYFEGFILLEDGCFWKDLNIQDKVDQSEYLYLKLSEDKELYFLEDIDKIKHEIAAAIDNKIIKGAAIGDFMLDKDMLQGEHLSLDSIGAYCFHYEFGRSDAPYSKLNSPKFPLHVSQLNAEKLHYAPVFNDVSFADIDYFFQPLQYISSRVYSTYFIKDYTPDELLERGYLRVNSDNSEEFIYALIPHCEFIERKINLENCQICEVGRAWYSETRCETKAKQDYPPVVFLQAFDTDCTKTGENIKRIIDKLQVLNIQDFDLYQSFCVKCKRHREEATHIEDLKFRFNNCHALLMQEIELLLPNLIIGVGETVFDLLQSQFEINAKQFENGKLTEISIRNRKLPYLMLSDDFSDKSVFMRIVSACYPIKNKLTDIVNRKRKISAKKRVLSIEEGEKLIKDKGNVH